MTVDFLDSVRFTHEQTATNPALKAEDVWLITDTNNANSRIKLQTSNNPTGDYVLAYDSTNGILKWVANMGGGGGSTTFSGLSDVEGYSIATGYRGSTSTSQILILNSTGDGIAWATALDFGELPEASPGQPRQQPDRRAPQRSGGPSGQGEEDDQMHDPQFGP